MAENIDRSLFVAQMRELLSHGDEVDRCNAAGTLGRLGAVGQIRKSLPEDIQWVEPDTRRSAARAAHETGTELRNRLRGQLLSAVLNRRIGRVREPGRLGAQSDPWTARDDRLLRLAERPNRGDRPVAIELLEELCLNRPAQNKRTA